MKQGELYNDFMKYGGSKMDKTADVIRDGKDIVVVANEKEVFRKPKTTQTVAIAHVIYMAYKYENGR